MREVDFSTREHCLVFRRIQSLLARGTSVDLTTLTNDLAQSGELEIVGGAGYIAALIDGIPHLSNITHYAQIVRDHTKRRELIKFGAKLQDLVWGGGLETNSMVNYAVDSVLQIARYLKYISTFRESRYRQLPLACSSIRFLNSSISSTV